MAELSHLSKIAKCEAPTTLGLSRVNPRGTPIPRSPLPRLPRFRREGYSGPGLPPATRFQSSCLIHLRSTHPPVQGQARGHGDDRFAAEKPANLPGEPFHSEQYERRQRPPAHREILQPQQSPAVTPGATAPKQP